MTGAGTRRLAVVGWPVEHSLSPALHGAAARELGLDWDYGRCAVPPDGLRSFVDALGPEWLGLSVTAPHKDDAAAIADELDPLARATGTANTLLRGHDGRLRGWSTDVGGIVRAFADAGLDDAGTGAIVGAGATAQTALLALARMGARHVTVALRTPAKAARLRELAAELGVTLAVQGLEAPLPGVDAAVSTLPAAADATASFAAPPVLLLDADYARPEGSRFLGALPAGRVIDGRAMLLQQAVLQVRIFALGDVDAPLPDEPRVVAAMRAALVARGTGVRASDSLEES
ncbi:shikimate dehydrogenase family protein [Agrococcus sp. DT81.2]|uniref:shikimate dehydrogenase family protein n=1 Tax=Agrococcus sp. DT81.2 TaxID=3393414 RepID=UPI003CE5873C